MLSKYSICEDLHVIRLPSPNGLLLQEMCASEVRWDWEDVQQVGLHQLKSDFF